jgi:hypothetical protein
MSQRPNLMRNNKRMIGLAEVVRKVRQETEDSIPPHLRTASVQLRRVVENFRERNKKPSESDTNAKGPHLWSRSQKLVRLLT